MAESLTIARPYAEAAFQRAVETSGLPAWSDALARLAAVMKTDEARALVLSPRFDTERVATLIAEAAGLEAEEPRNFVRLLARNDRLVVVREIYEQYEELRNRHEQTFDVEVRSAFALTEAQTADIVAALQERYGRRIKATAVVDPELIGGVSIRIGDEVIDASVRGKLAQLATTLTA